MEEDHRPVIGPDIRALPVELGRVMDRPEHIKELLVTHFGRIVIDLHYLRMPGFTRTYLFVRRIFQ